MLFQNLVLGAIQTNCYIVSANSHDAVVIDPACDYQEIKQVLQKNGLTAKAVLLTHGHFDHHGAAAALQREGAQVYLNREDLSWLDYRPAFFSGEDFEPDVFLNDGQIINIAGLEIRVIFCAGHTLGGVCFLIGDKLFSGDSLFCNDVGRTDLAGGDFETLKANILTKLFVLDDNIIVYPGHGQSTTIGAEKKHNYALK